MCCKNFLKVHKNTSEKMFVKYLSAEGCLIKTILLTVMITRMIRALDFTKQPMKRNFT